MAPHREIFGNVPCSEVSALDHCEADLMNPDRILKGTFLVAAFASFVLSIVIYFQAGDDINGRLNGIYVGIWVPSILALGAFVLARGRSAK
ncbi:MAG: hypothetical protein ACO3C1_03990 [Ilumatobacteraceae bacterium]